MLLDWIVFSGTVPQFFGAYGISCRNFKLLFNNSSTPQPFHISDIFWQTIKQQRFCNLKAVCLLFSFSLSTSKVESSIFFPQLPRSDFYHILSSCTSQFWIYYILNQRGVQFLKFTADWVMYQRRPRHSAWFQTVSLYLKGKWTVLKSCHIEITMSEAQRTKKLTPWPGVISLIPNGATWISFKFYQKRVAGKG